MYTQDSRRLGALQRSVATLRRVLRRRECNSLPCQRGGTCIDAYNGFQCLCPQGWTGSTCSRDVDECMEYRGTDLGCQNGGTCINTDGGYRCSCPGGWYGRHCTLREDSCNTGSVSSLCDHGDCYSQASEGRSYTCRCHQGWTKAAGSHMCSQDVDECTAGRTNHCSVNPVTQCINLPGSYMCGPCPAG
ncbi:EGF-like calcium-binding domain, partial [Trinorchestia longiramus]